MIPVRGQFLATKLTRRYEFGRHVTRVKFGLVANSFTSSDGTVFESSIPGGHIVIDVLGEENADRFAIGKVYNVEFTANEEKW